LNHLSKINLLISQKKITEAINLIESLLSKYSNNIDLLLMLGGCYRSLGKFDNARDVYSQIIKIDFTNTTAHRLYGDYIGINKYHHHEVNLNKLKNLDLSDEKKTNLFFAFGNLYEKLNEYKKASYYFKEANNLKNKVRPFNFNQLKKHFKNLEYIYENLNLDKLILEGQKKIIFIVGLPRSGTSLVEAILGANNKIYNAGEIPNLNKTVKINFVKDGELNLLNINKIINYNPGNIYNNYINFLNLSQVSKEIITDKNTENFKFLGLINIFFTHSKIINCTRNIFDNSFSLYKTNFNSPRLNWTNSISQIKLYREMYLDLINILKTKLGNKIFDINYDNLITNSQKTIRDLVNFCDLEYSEIYENFNLHNTSPVKTASSNQIRNPIQKNSLFKYNKFKEYFDFN